MALSTHSGTPSFECRRWSCTAACGAGAGGNGIVAVGCGTLCAGRAAGYIDCCCGCAVEGAWTSPAIGAVCTNPSASSSLSPSRPSAVLGPALLPDISSLQPIFSSLGTASSSFLLSGASLAASFSDSVRISRFDLQQEGHFQARLWVAMVRRTESLHSRPPS